MDRLTKLINEISNLAGKGFTGYIRINFSQGSLGRIEKFEEIAEPVLAEMVEAGRSKKYGRKIQSQ